MIKFKTRDAIMTDTSLHPELKDVSSGVHVIIGEALSDRQIIAEFVNNRGLVIHADRAKALGFRIDVLGKDE